jgi:hypothetical protein
MTADDDQSISSATEARPLRYSGRTRSWCRNARRTDCEGFAPTRRRRPQGRGRPPEDLDGPPPSMSQHRDHETPLAHWQDHPHKVESTPSPLPCGDLPPTEYEAMYYREQAWGTPSRQSQPQESQGNPGRFTPWLRVCSKGGESHGARDRHCQAAIPDTDWSAR